MAYLPIRNEVDVKPLSFYGQKEKTGDSVCDPPNIAIIPSENNRLGG